MKKIFFLFALSVVIISCKKESNLPDDGLEYADFEISYQQSGDVDKINSVFVISSSEHIYEKGKSKNLGNVINLSEKIQGSKEKFTYTVKGRTLVFTSANSLKQEYLTDDSANTKFSIKVLKNNKEIFNQSYTIDKDNVDENFQVSLNAKD